MQTLRVEFCVCKRVFIRMREARVGFDEPVEDAERLSGAGEYQGELPDEELSAAQCAVIGILSILNEFCTRQVFLVIKTERGDIVGFGLPFVYPVLIGSGEFFEVSAVFADAMNGREHHLGASARIGDMPANLGCLLEEVF